MQPVDVLGHDGHFESRLFKVRVGVFVRFRLRLRPGVRYPGAGQGLDRDVCVVRPQPTNLVEHAPVQEPAQTRVLAERAQGAVLLRVVRLPDRKQRVQRRRRADADAVRVDVHGAGDGFAKRGHARLGARARAGEKHHARETEGLARRRAARSTDAAAAARAAPERPPLRGDERLRVEEARGRGVTARKGFRIRRYQSRRRRRRTEARAVRRSLRALPVPRRGFGGRDASPKSASPARSTTRRNTAGEDPDIRVFAGSTPKPSARSKRTASSTSASTEPSAKHAAQPPGTRPRPTTLFFVSENGASPECVT